MTIQSVIDTEKGKVKKDYKRLKQLKSDLEAQLARDEQRTALEVQLAVAEEVSDYDRCGEIQEQLDALSAEPLVTATADKGGPKSAVVGEEEEESAGGGG